MSGKGTKTLCILLAILTVLLAASTAWLAIDRSHYKRYKNVISQDEVENTLFGQPISTERDGEYRLAV